MLEFINDIKLPVWSICYLVNGDSSALTDEDIEQVDIWLESLDFNCLTFEFEDEESYFCSFPEFGLASDVLDCKLHGYKKDK